MNSHWAKKSRVAFALATVAHVLGWAAFLWIVLWPNSYQGVSATPVSVDGPNFYRGVSATLLNVDGTGATESVEVHRYSSFTGSRSALPLLSNSKTHHGRISVRPAKSGRSTT